MNRLETLKARMMTWEKSPILTRVNVPIDCADIARLIAVVDGALLTPLSMHSKELKKALAYWLDDTP